MKRNKDKTIGINTLLAILEIENYSDFSFDLGVLVSQSISLGKTNKAENRIQKIYDIATGKFVFGFKEYKEFVKKYQKVFDIFKKYNCMRELTILKYGITGIKYSMAYDDYFNIYSKIYSDSLDRMKTILIDLRNLGFKYISYNPDYDFTSSEYSMRMNYSNLGLSDFQFLENIYALPNYDKNSIKYKTHESVYRMSLHFDKSINGERATIESRTVQLKSLIFDPNRLPKTLLYEDTVGLVLEAENKIENLNQTIRNSVDFSSSIDSLISDYNITREIVESIAELKDKDEVKEILIQASRYLNELKVQCASYKKISADKISDAGFEEQSKSLLNKPKLD